MDVILRQDVEKLGNAGDLVTVKDGYARNFLLPRGLAYLATEGNKKRLEAEAQMRVRKAGAQLGVARELATQLEAVSLTFTMKAGEGDKLFGSVTAADVAERLHARGLRGGQEDGRAARADQGARASTRCRCACTTR